MGTIGSLVPKLFQLLGHEYKLQTGLKKEVHVLTEKLESIHAFLHTVSDVPWDQLDEQVKVWAGEAREASYDMEDVIDSFFVRCVESQELPNTGRLQNALKKLFSLFSMVKARRDIGGAIEDIKNRLQDVADKRAMYRIDDIVENSTATRSAVDPRLRAMYKEVADFVGIDKPRDDLIFKLSCQSNYVARGKKKIVAIVGIGGLGKTTLAKTVYDKIRVDFDCDAFVMLGRNPNLTKVLMDILYELDKKKYADIHAKNRDQRQLIDNLREFLGNKRYFIVIDDIWENRQWEEVIQLALVENNLGSRLIITTRNCEVATTLGDDVYRMEPLSDDNSKKLLYTRIRRDDWRCPDNQPDEILKKILKKCDGVPLAIITIVSLLVGKPRERWPDLFTSLCFGLKDDKQVENTMKMLSYSYYDMPAHLRTCLLYLSVFPEDYTIDKESLIWKWIAEGFIKGKKQGLFELGRNTLMILARRIAQYNNFMEDTFNDNAVRMPQVRSFISYSCAFNKWIPLLSFSRLRVLEMEGCKNVRSSHLVHLGNLLHLRYLGMENTQVDELPNEIEALKHLQILNLAMPRIRHLTPSISRLPQLLCLIGDLSSTLAPSWVGKLTSLEELQVAMRCSSYNRQDQASGFLTELSCLSELRVCRIRMHVELLGDVMERDLVSSIRNLQKLQHLELGRNWNFTEAHTAIWGEAGFVLPRHLRILDLEKFRFSSLPSCISAACLPSLSMCVTAVDQKGLEFLARLPELQYLVLTTWTTATLSNFSAGNGYFQKLRFCQIYDSMIQLQWKEEDSSVSFHLWDGLDAMPFGKNNCSVLPSDVMPNLEELECTIFPQGLKDCNRASGYNSLQYLLSLRKVRARISCHGAHLGNAFAAEQAVKKATEVHPNRPTLDVYRWGVTSDDSVIFQIVNKN
ncbi:hypothetical protein EJB05_26213, partial [Eragrostis curvula]